MASASDAEPIVPPAFIFKSCVSVTSPVDEILIASVSDVEPILPPSFIIRLPVEVMFPVTDIALSKVPPSLLLTASADEKVSYARISTSSLRLSAVRPAIVFAVEVL